MSTHVAEDQTAAPAPAVPAPALAPRRIAMPGIRKAAILMVALGDEIAHKLFQNLPEQDIQRLTAEIASVQNIEPELSDQVVEEFFEILETQHCVMRGGIDYATKVLVEAFGRQRTEDLLSQV